MDDLADPCFLARTQQDRGPADVDRLEQLPRPGPAAPGRRCGRRRRRRRRARATVVASRMSPCTSSTSAGRSGGVDQVEHPHPVAGLAQVLGRAGTRSTRCRRSRGPSRRSCRRLQSGRWGDVDAGSRTTGWTGASPRGERPAARSPGPRRSGRCRTRWSSYSSPSTWTWVVAAPPLQLPVGPLRRGRRRRRNPEHAVSRAVDPPRPGPGAPWPRPRPAGRRRGRRPRTPGRAPPVALGQRDPLDEVVDVRHRPPLAAVARGPGSVPLRTIEKNGVCRAGCQGP